MTTKRPYSYTVLRYVHDVMTGEFVNVGLVLHQVSSGTLISKTRTSVRRIREMFPTLDRSAFVASIRAVQRGLADLANEKQFLFASENDAGACAHYVLTADDSSLQWSPTGVGITDDIQCTFNRLYERLVSRYDIHTPNRRSDEDVWRPVRAKLEEKHLAQYLREKAIWRGRQYYFQACVEEWGVACL